MIVKIRMVGTFLIELGLCNHRESNWKLEESSRFNIISQSSENSDPSPNSNNQRAIEILENEELK